MSDNASVVQHIIVDKASRVVKVVLETRIIENNPNPTMLKVVSTTQKIYVNPG